MENKLKALFDYQRFEKNEKLERLIRETETRYAAKLSDDALSLVNAAGELVTHGAINIENSTVEAYISHGAGIGGGKQQLSPTKE
jgi:hypothetical protein